MYCIEQRFPTWGTRTSMGTWEFWEGTPNFQYLNIYSNISSENIIQTLPCLLGCVSSLFLLGVREQKKVGNRWHRIMNSRTFQHSKCLNMVFITRTIFPGLILNLKDILICNFKNCQNRRYLKVFILRRYIFVLFLFCQKKFVWGQTFRSFKHLNQLTFFFFVFEAVYRNNNSHINFGQLLPLKELCKCLNCYFKRHLRKLCQYILCTFKFIEYFKSKQAKPYHIQPYSTTFPYLEEVT